MRFILIVCIFSLFVNCKSPTALLMDKAFIEKYPELSDKSMLSQLEKNRSRALNCYLSNENKNNFIFIEIERYPNGDFSSMKYLSYFYELENGNELYTCNYDKEISIYDGSGETTYKKVVSLMEKSQFSELEKMANSETHKLNEAGTMYVTKFVGNRVSKALKISEFIIDDTPPIPKEFNN